jgi:alkylhydroperoxidase family enzyme
MRIQVIVRFAEKCAFEHGNMSDEDYEQVRAQGVSEEEIIEIVALAALGTYLDVMADSLKLNVDDVIAQALAA